MAEEIYPKETGGLSGREQRFVGNLEYHQDQA
jgi:hypothetical protein